MRFVEGVDMRVRTRWKDSQRQRKPKEIASALGATIWKAAGQLVLTLENEGFQTESNSQRLEVFAEVCAYMLQLVDRQLHATWDQPRRAEFITELARSMAQLMQENRGLIEGAGDYRTPFIDLLNRRGAEYSASSWDESEGPSFVMRRNFGNHVSASMGPRDRKWITDYVMDVEAPKLRSILSQAIPGLLG